MGHIPGVILGAILLTLLPEVLRYTMEPLQHALFGRVYIDAEIVRLLVFGIALVAIMHNTTLNRSMLSLFAVLGVILICALPARAEQGELRVAKQYGLGYLQMMVLEDLKIVEKNAAAAGLGDIKVTWATFRSSDVMNDALLSGNVDFVCLGIPGLATIWGKTKGGLDVKAASGFNFLPLQLNTRNANIKSIRDLTEKDRIALPAVKVSMCVLPFGSSTARPSPPPQASEFSCARFSGV